MWKLNLLTLITGTFKLCIFPRAGIDDCGFVNYYRKKYVRRAFLVRGRMTDLEESEHGRIQNEGF